MNFNGVPVTGFSNSNSDYGNIPNNNKLGEYLKLWQGLGLNDNWNYNNKKAGLDFAAMMARNDQVANSANAPNFFGQSGGQGFSQGEYVAPQYTQTENPYFQRANELNNNPMANALKKMMGR